MPSDLDSLGSAQYVLLTTFRKDGTAVGTPLWVARGGSELLVWTVSDSWKVKRIRRNPEVLVAPCDMRGRIKGDSVEGTARVLDLEATEQARAAIAKKYGIVGRLTMTASNWRRGRDGTVGLAIALRAPA
ncbi:MAG: PPOX class F420-dependent oxidoreductase [Mycobacteriaceae bacterium]